MVTGTMPWACLFAVSKTVCAQPTPSVLGDGDTEGHGGGGRGCLVKQSSSFHDRQEAERRGPETS